MASLVIPEAVQEGLLKIASLDEESFQEFLGCLQRSHPSVSPSKFAAKVCQGIKNLSKEDVADITQALFSMAYGRSLARVPVAQFVSDIVDTLKEEAGHVDSEIFKNRLAQVFEVPSIKLGSKAYTLLFAHNHNLLGTRIFTDIRPIFGDGDTDSPEAAVITHSLKLEYVTSNEPQEFFIALDTSDIQKLIDTLERAKKKADSLKSILAAAEILYIDPE